MRRGQNNNHDHDRKPFTSMSSLRGVWGTDGGSGRWQESHCRSTTCCPGAISDQAYWRSPSNWPQGGLMAIIHSPYSCEGHDMLTITHSKWDSEDHFEALGFDESEPNLVIRFDYAMPNGWQRWRHGSWLPITLNDVP